MTSKEQNNYIDKSIISESVSVKKSKFCTSLLSIFSYCPYTMLGKKIIWFLRGVKDVPHEPLTSNERYLKSKTTFGIGIMLIGVFCPIFWISVFTGAQGDELLRSGINSFLVILFGIFYIGYYRFQSRKKRAREEIRGRTWPENE